MTRRSSLSDLARAVAAFGLGAGTFLLARRSRNLPARCISRGICMRCERADVCALPQAGEYRTYRSSESSFSDGADNKTHGERS